LKASTASNGPSGSDPSPVRAVSKLSPSTGVSASFSRAIPIMAEASSVPVYRATEGAILSALDPVPQPSSSTSASGASRARVRSSVFSQFSGLRTGLAA
jgi:hypothetical protein